MDAADLQAIAQRVHKRVTAWLRRHGYLDDRPLEERSNEAAEQGALEACAEVAMQRGAFAKLDAKDAAAEAVEAATNGGPPKLRFAAEHAGFNLHAFTPACTSPLATIWVANACSATGHGRGLRSIDFVGFRTAASPRGRSRWGARRCVGGDRPRRAS